LGDYACYLAANGWTFSQPPTIGHGSWCVAVSVLLQANCHGTSHLISHCNIEVLGLLLALALG